MDARLIQVPKWQIALICLLALIAYVNSFSVPFYLDDFTSIINSESVKRGNWLNIWMENKQRIVTYASFAVNYRFSGETPFSYHAANLAIHLGASLALWWLTSLLCATLSGDREISLHPGYVPLFAAAMYVVHPLQTQAVTYIVQRGATLAALFYLLGLAVYVKARKANQSGWFIAAAALAALGMASKQNAATLPLAILLLESLFLQATATRKRIAAAILLLAMLAWLVAIMQVPALDALTRETTAISRADYFATQLAALWIYIAKFFVPWGLKLEYDLPLQHGFPLYPTGLALAGHIALLMVAIAVRSKLPLATFGIAFYYLAHIVESTIFPITDLVFEHRTYLPNAGMCLAVASLAIGWGGEAVKRAPALKFVPVFAVMALCLLTLMRNQEWNDPIVFHERNAALAPGSYRPELALNAEYLKRNELAGAASRIESAISKYQAINGSAELDEHLFHNLLLTQMRLGQYPEVIRLATMKQINIDTFSPTLRSNVLTMRGRSYAATNDLNAALADFKAAVAVNSANSSAWTNMGTAYAIMQRFGDAEAAYREALRWNPNFSEAQDNLAKLQPYLMH